MVLKKDGSTRLLFGRNNDTVLSYELNGSGL
jgi:hypothetical protein